MPAYASGFIIEGMINTASFIVRDCFVVPYFGRLSTSSRNDLPSEEYSTTGLHRKDGHGEGSEAHFDHFDKLSDRGSV